MYEDPIVTEVRSAGQLLAEEAGGDLHLFFQRLREAQKQYPDMMKLSDIPAKFYSSSPDTFISSFGIDI
jgi:hypothetical protein